MLPGGLTIGGFDAGIGALSSLMYVSTVENPSRFSRSRAVGAHLGLTPRRYQSGETDRSGYISRCGDGLARTLTVRGSNCDPSSCEAIATPEGLGRGDRATLGFRQAGSLSTQAVRHPAQCLAIWRVHPLGPAGHDSVAPSKLVKYANTHRPRARVRAIARRAGGRVINASPLWTLQCLSSGPDQMLRQLALTAKRTMTRAGDVNGSLTLTTDKPGDVCC